MIAIIVACSASLACAQDWTITTADFHTRAAALRGLSTDGVMIAGTASGLQQTIPLDRFVSIQRTGAGQAATPKFTLLLSDGDRLAGEPNSISGEQLLWKSPALGDVPVPLRQLVLLSRGGDATAPNPRPKQDIVTLANGDAVSGVVTDCSSEQVTVQTDNGSRDVPLGAVTKIAFAATTSAPAASGHGYRVRLADGSAVTATDASVAADQLSLTVAGKPPLKVAVPLARVLGIEQLNGPVSWLSSRVATENVQTPYFGGAPAWPAVMDAAVDGAPLTFNDQRFEHGIGVHAYSRLTFPIEPGWAAFRTQYAIESDAESPRPLADVTVRIKLDGKVVHEQSHVHAGVLSPVVSLDVHDAKTLTLEADYGDGGDTQAHLNWIEPALLRAAPTTR
jgi:hypothetical protein